MKPTPRNWLVTVLFASLVAGGSWAQDQPDKTRLDTKRLDKLLGEPTPSARADSDLDRLLADRVVAGNKVYEAQRARYESNKATLEDVAQAARRLLAAELATKTTPQDRIAVLEKAVAVEKEFERVIEAQVQGGKAAAYVLDNARYDRLTAEIELAKAKKGGGPK